MVRAMSQPFQEGSRVQLHPGTDRWMMGDKFGEIVEVREEEVKVKLDRSGKSIWFPADRVNSI